MYEHVGSAFEWRSAGEVLHVEAWGPHAVRVRAAADSIDWNAAWALDQPVELSETDVTVRDDGTARLVNGRITIEGDEQGRLRFLRTAADSAEPRELLADKRPYTWHPGPRVHAALGDGTYRLEQIFEGYDDERIHGLGQHLHGRLDQKGCVVDLVQGNAQVAIPFLHSSRGYGLLWNNPAIGRIELGADATRWVAEQARQIDYWIVAGDTPAEIMSAYADATGHPPLIPDWASGFWQSKLRYRTQEELLSVAREHHRRGLPLSVIVCDFFHWSKMGDWCFDREHWPDPAAMTKELDALGVKLVVSVWPTLEADGANHEPLRACGGLVRDGRGGLLRQPWPAHGHGEEYVPMAYYDATDPVARSLLWEQLHKNYVELGVTGFWLDACEPDLAPELARRALYAAGPGTQVGNVYGKLHARAVAEGLAGTGEDRPLSLIRSAWAGSQRYGTALWSGDIDPTFASLATQIRAGLNVAMSGIPWWNTDIGGFQGGDPQDPDYRELLIRWFQYGTFSPIMRLHGDRQPKQSFTAAMTGGPNEVWSYGEQAYSILCEHLELRERLRPYIHRLADAAHESGAPVMRPLFFDFPADTITWSIDDQFLLGPDLLVAPVTELGARERPVYLPGEVDWIEVATCAVRRGGETVRAQAPLTRIPIFVREGTALAETLINVL